MRSLDFSIDLILPAALWLSGSTQSLTEMSTRNLCGSKGRPVHEADNLTAVSRLPNKCRSLNTSQLYGPPRPVTWTALPTFSAMKTNFGMVIAFSERGGWRKLQGVSNRGTNDWGPIVGGRVSMIVRSLTAILRTQENCICCQSDTCIIIIDSGLIYTSQGVGYEILTTMVMGCNAVFSVESQSTFRRNISPPSSG
jgi:hypothetical protein